MSKNETRDFVFMIWKILKNFNSLKKGLDGVRGGEVCDNTHSFFFYIGAKVEGVLNKMIPNDCTVL